MNTLQGECTILEVLEVFGSAHCPETISVNLAFLCSSENEYRNE